MPILNAQIDPDGPTVRIAVGASRPRIAALHRLGQAVPQPRLIRALLDTGASCTAIDSNVLRSLDLTPTGTVAIHTPSSSGSGHRCDQYDVSIVLINAPDVHVMSFTIPVIECDLTAQGIEALIGRDLLDRCLLIYNGPVGVLSLSY